MIFNNIDFSNYFRIKDIRKSMLPSIESHLYDVQPRKVLGKSKLDVGYIEVDIRIKSDSKKNLNKDTRNLAGLLYTREERKLILPDDEDIYYMAKLDGDTGLRRLLTYNDTTLTFLTPDPAYSITPTTYTNIHNKTLENQGTADATGQITITMTDASFLKVTLQNTGEFLYLEDNFIDGDEILIDLEQEFVKKNGNLIMNKLYFESDFFMIPRGEFRITLSSGVGDLEFRERWL